MGAPESAPEDAAPSAAGMRPTCELIVPVQDIAAPHGLRTTSRNRSDLQLHRRRLACGDVARLRRAAAAHLRKHLAEDA